MNTLYLITERLWLEGTGPSPVVWHCQSWIWADSSQKELLHLAGGGVQKAPYSQG